MPVSRPADPATPGQPSNVHVTALGGGRVLIHIDGARHANSFSYYRQITGTDPEPVKATNTEGTQYPSKASPPARTCSSP